MTIAQLEEEIKKIEERNKRVETEKSWEISWTRRLMIAVLTYIVIAIFFKFAKVENPLESAIVPALAFIISTSSMPIFKKIWLKYLNKNLG